MIKFLNNAIFFPSLFFLSSPRSELRREERDFGEKQLVSHINRKNVEKNRLSLSPSQFKDKISVVGRDGTFVRLENNLPSSERRRPSLNGSSTSTATAAAAASIVGGSQNAGGHNSGTAVVVARGYADPEP